MNGEINKSTLGAALSKSAPEGSANKPPRIATVTTTSHADTHADALHSFLPAPRPRLHFHYNFPLLILLKSYFRYVFEKTDLDSDLDSVNYTQICNAGRGVPGIFSLSFLCHAQFFLNLLGSVDEVAQVKRYRIDWWGLWRVRRDIYSWSIVWPRHPK